VLLAIYSKVLEGIDQVSMWAHECTHHEHDVRRAQGAFMGWFTAAISTARIVGPLGASYVIDEDETGRWMFGGVAAVR
jgi:hypothetical protein